MRWRNRSRSSGVRLSQRSSIRRRMREQDPPRPKPPKRIRQSTRRPSACQKVTCGAPASGGSSQFHSSITIPPPAKAKKSIPRIASGAISSILSPRVIVRPSFLRQFVVEIPEPRPQVQHRIPLAREQGIDADARLGGHRLERAALELVPDEHGPLFLGQLVESPLELVEEQVARMNR